MTGLFGEDEIFEDEWVEICDIEGHRMSMRHLATMRLGEKTYMLLDDGDEQAHGGALMLVREDRTVDGALEYVVSNDEQEIERVMGRFAAHLFEMQWMDEAAQEETDTDLPGIHGYGEDCLPAEELTGDTDRTCGFEHGRGEFCYCDDPKYLQ